MAKSRGDGSREGGEGGPRRELATFAGGCFWCMVKPFDELPGIVSVVSGYTGGWTENPTYEEVGTETTGHYEAVQITYEPELFPYERLLELYWRQIDPTDAGGQFLDRGNSYRTAIFVHNERQRELAEASRREVAASRRFKGRIVTEILPAGAFYPAEAEHQHYYKHRPFDYKLYMKGSGREDYLDSRWNKPEDRERLRRSLTALEYEVTQNRGMEPAYENEHWNNRRPGLYVDVISGDPLFRTADQFDAGDGWPAFTRPLAEGLVRREADLRPDMPRTALRSRLSGAWLGHLLHDGPEPDGLHYRINSAALRFVPAEELTRRGLGRFAELAAELATEREPKQGTEMDRGDERNGAARRRGGPERPGAAGGHEPPTD